MDKSEFLPVARALAVEAGDIIMEIYEQDDLGTRAKADDSPVTRADEAADAHISAGLRFAFPDAALVTEEQAATHAQQLSTFLIVDPLDGTKEFIHRRGDFTVNIAFVADGVPTMGVVYAPARRLLYYTDLDGGATMETGDIVPNQAGTVSKISAVQGSGTGLRVVASKSHRDAATDAYIARYDVAEFTSAGSSLKFCLVAAGQAELYPRLGRTMEWDTAAGDAVLRAAGGSVVRFDDRQPLGYGKPGFENPFFVAHAPGVDVLEG